MDYKTYLPYLWIRVYLIDSIFIIIILRRLIFSIQAKVVDSKGEMVPFGTPGELLIRGYVNMLGYFMDEKKTQETIDPSKWLHTG